MDPEAVREIPVRKNQIHDPLWYDKTPIVGTKRVVQEPALEEKATRRGGGGTMHGGAFHYKCHLRTKGTTVSTHIDDAGRSGATCPQRSVIVRGRWRTVRGNRRSKLNPSRGDRSITLHLSSAFWGQGSTSPGMRMVRVKRTERDATLSGASFFLRTHDVLRVRSYPLIRSIDTRGNLMRKHRL